MPNASALERRGNAALAQLSPQQERVLQARQRLQAYREYSRYPVQSRPIDEHPEQILPFADIQSSVPLQNKKGQASGIHLLVTQNRVFLSGADTARFTVALVDSQNRPLPAIVQRSVARGLQTDGSSTGMVNLAFNDSGTQGDSVAGDGVYSVQWQPSSSGFANFEGTIRTEVYLLGTEDTGPGQTYFDLVYTPLVPATWLGQSSEQMENGSLAIQLAAQVNEAGTYIVTARAYDARGKAFALLTASSPVATGVQNIRFLLFGKLLRDYQIHFPITLRDVDGFLLREDHFPDRASMPRWAGVAHTSANYALETFSDATWSSEQRTRYLNEYAKDLQAAEQALQ